MVICWLENKVVHNLNEAAIDCMSVVNPTREETKLSKASTTQRRQHCANTTTWQAQASRSLEKYLRLVDKQQRALSPKQPYKPPQRDITAHHIRKATLISNEPKAKPKLCSATRTLLQTTNSFSGLNEASIDFTSVVNPPDRLVPAVTMARGVVSTTEPSSFTQWKFTGQLLLLFQVRVREHQSA